MIPERQGTYREPRRRRVARACRGIAGARPELSRSQRTSGQSENRDRRPRRRALAGARILPWRNEARRLPRSGENPFLCTIACHPLTTEPVEETHCPRFFCMFLLFCSGLITPFFFSHRPVAEILPSELNSLPRSASLGRHRGEPLRKSVLSRHARGRELALLAKGAGGVLLLCGMLATTNPRSYRGVFE